MYLKHAVPHSRKPFSGIEERLRVKSYPLVRLARLEKKIHLEKNNSTNLESKKLSAFMLMQELKRGYIANVILTPVASF